MNLMNYNKKTKKKSNNNLEKMNHKRRTKRKFRNKINRN